jgi:hypothetical protein
VIAKTVIVTDWRISMRLVRFASRANQTVGLDEHAVAFILRTQEKADGDEDQAKQ